MSALVFGVVLLSAALHATWNAVVKGGNDKLMSTALITAFAALLSLACLPFLPPLDPAAYPWLAISVVLQVAYYAFLAASYTHADMSRAYPLMRGTPPLIVAIVSTVWLGVSINLAGWIGIGLVSAALVALTFMGSGSNDRRGIVFALLNALVIAAYTLIDATGSRLSGSSLAYTTWMFVLLGVPFTAFLVLLRRRAFFDYARRNWLAGLIGGAGTLISYAIALWAMTQAPVPLVASLRESSILFATAIAVFVLHEKVSRNRIAAVLVIAVGAAVLKLA